jgi:hypothetical protein
MDFVGWNFGQLGLLQLVEDTFGEQGRGWIPAEGAEGVELLEPD